MKDNAIVKVSKTKEKKRELNEKEKSKRENIEQ